MVKRYWKSATKSSRDWVEALSEKFTKLRRKRLENFWQLKWKKQSSISDILCYTGKANSYIS